MKKETQYQAEILKRALMFGLATPLICVDWAKMTLASPLDAHPSLVEITKPQEKESFIQNLDKIVGTLSLLEQYNAMGTILGRICVIGERNNSRLKGFAYKLYRFCEEYHFSLPKNLEALINFDFEYSNVSDEIARLEIDKRILAFLSTFKNELSAQDNWYLFYSDTYFTQMKEQGSSENSKSWFDSMLEKFCISVPNSNP